MKVLREDEIKSRLIIMKKAMQQILAEENRLDKKTLTDEIELKNIEIQNMKDKMIVTEKTLTETIKTNLSLDIDTRKTFKPIWAGLIKCCLVLLNFFLPFLKNFFPNLNPSLISILCS